MNSELNNLEWFKTGFETYNPKSETLLKIQKSLKSYTIKVVIDVNCKDVQFLIPKLFKTLYLCDVNDYEIYYVDKLKLPCCINTFIKIIEKVPTIIFAKNNKEQFRIIEKTIYTSTIENEIEVILSEITNKNK